MKSSLLALALAIAATSGTNAALAATKHRAHHDRAPTRIASPQPPYAAAAGSQPVMYEARPGWWISSYDCVADEGQGRFWPCSSLGAGRR